MPEEKEKAVAKLETLAKHLHAGWKKLYPVSNENLKKVREAVARQWEQQQATKKRSTKTKSRNQGHDQEHEH